MFVNKNIASLCVEHPVFWYTRKFRRKVLSVSLREKGEKSYHP